MADSYCVIKINPMKITLGLEYTSSPRCCVISSPMSDSENARLSSTWDLGLVIKWLQRGEGAAERVRKHGNMVGFFKSIEWKTNHFICVSIWANCFYWIIVKFLLDASSKMFHFSLALTSRQKKGSSFKEYISFIRTLIHSNWNSAVKSEFVVGYLPKYLVLTIHV